MPEVRSDRGSFSHSRDAHELTACPISLIGAARKDGTLSSAISPQMVNPGVTSRRKTVYWKSFGENCSAGATA